MELKVVRKKIYSWPDGNTTTERTKIGNLFSYIGPSQVIPEPIKFEPNKNPTCIDLVFTDQPNLILDSETRPSSDSFCHHEITYCKTSFSLQPPPPYQKDIWHYHRTNIALLWRCMTTFPWIQQT